jgi:hypothetical protein
MIVVRARAGLAMDRSVHLEDEANVLGIKRDMISAMICL